ncbi:MAG TPA: Gfo/Idh/MocA family oxidoreductase, partial [Actinomycetota bacterium]
MRLGLLGLGRIGEFHADTLASLPMVDSLVVADIIPDLTTKVADRLGAEPAASPDALLRAGLDGVVIAAGTDAHPELIVAAVDAGLPVFCEKPLARTIAEGAEVVARVKASGVPV